MGNVVVCKVAFQTIETILKQRVGDEDDDEDDAHLCFSFQQELCQVLQQPDVKVLKNYIKVGLVFRSVIVSSGLSSGL